MNANSVLLLIVFVVCGYVLHPIVLPGLRSAGIVKPAAEAETTTAEVTVASVDRRDTTVVDLSSVTPEDFPSEVELLESVQVKLPGVETPIPIKAGTMVVPKILDGDDLSFQAPGLADLVRTRVDKTNFKKLVKPILASKAQRGPQAPVKPDPLAQEQVTPDPQPTPQPNPAPAPSAEVELNEAQIVRMMQQSVRSGKVTEFRFEQVLGWKMEADENIDGESYQIGLIVYNAETIFGVQKQRAKALFKNGKLVKWIWPDLGVEIR